MNESLWGKGTAVGNSYQGVLFLKVLQGAFFLIGLVMLFFMLFIPSIGVTLFWNILIPVAPALLVLGAGLWRNVCPLGTTSLLPDRFGLSRNLKLSAQQRDVFNLIAVIALLLIIPLRHVWFNDSGQATAMLIMAIAFVAVLSGFLFERKSGWCSGLCPVHPVEKLYGAGVAFSLPNVHCGTCVHCSVPCPDSTTNLSLKKTKSKESIISKYLLVGAFPGYVWGWFQTPDFTGAILWQKILLVYATPLFGSVVTLIGFLVLKTLLGKNRETALLSLSAALTVSCYYWFRLPQLIGFNLQDANSVLVDLSNALPVWTPTLLHLMSSSFFLWWMVIRKKPVRSWSPRPTTSKVNVQ